MMDYQCIKCRHRVLMLDGNFWCNLTTKPVGRGFLATCPNFELGDGKLYKAEPQRIIPKQEERKIKRKEIKPIPIKQEPIRSNKKITSPQQKMF